MSCFGCRPGMAHAHLADTLAHSDQSVYYIDGLDVRGRRDIGVEFARTEEQELLQKTAAAFVAKYCPPEQAKAWDEAGVFPQDLWDQMRDLEWFSLPFSAEC